MSDDGSAFGRGRSRSSKAGVAEGLAKVESSWTAKPHQRAALADDHGIDLVIGGIGSGKSTTAAHKLLRWALRYPRRKSGAPTKWLLSGPDFSLLRQEQMELILEAASTLPIPVVRRVVYGMDPRIYLIHGQQIVCRSGSEPRRMRGHQFDGGFLDEGEQCPEEAFTMALARQRYASKIRLVVTTSPQNVRASWVWPLVSGQSEKHNKLLEAVPLRVHRWRSDQNDENEAEVLAAISAALEAGRAGMSRQELDGLFLGGEVEESSVFELAGAFPEQLDLTLQDARPAALGVDLGKSIDFTWLTVLSTSGVVLAMERFNVSTPNVPRDGFYGYVEHRVKSLVETWRIPLVKVDSAMTGASFADNLQRSLAGTPVRVQGYRTDAPRRKSEALEALGLALSRRQVRIPRRWRAPGSEPHTVEFVDQLRRELTELVVEQRGGFRTFDHPEGGHDDGCVSLALAFQGLTQRPAQRLDYSAWAPKREDAAPRFGSWGGSRFSGGGGGRFTGGSGAFTGGPCGV